MKKRKSIRHKKNSPLTTLRVPWRGPVAPHWAVLRGVGATFATLLLGIALFAAVFLLFGLNEGLIAAVNLVLRVIALGVGCGVCALQSTQKNLLWSILCGAAGMAAIHAVYWMTTGAAAPIGVWLNDTLLGIAVGAVLGFLVMRKSKA